MRCGWNGRGGERSDLGYRATDVECREVEFLAALPPLSGLFFFVFIIIVTCSFFFFTGSIGDIIVIMHHHHHHHHRRCYYYYYITGFTHHHCQRSDMVFITVTGCYQNSRSGRRPIDRWQVRVRRRGRRRRGGFFCLF